MTEVDELRAEIRGLRAGIGEIRQDIKSIGQALTELIRIDGDQKRQDDAIHRIGLEGANSKRIELMDDDARGGDGYEHQHDEGGRGRAPVVADWHARGWDTDGRGYGGDSLRRRQDNAGGPWE